MKFSNFFLFFFLINLSLPFFNSIKLDLTTNTYVKNTKLLSNKYGSNLRSLLTQELESANDIYNILTAELCIGNPSQCFKFAYDTGNASNLHMIPEINI